MYKLVPDEQKICSRHSHCSAVQSRLKIDTCKIETPIVHPTMMFELPSSAVRDGMVNNALSFFLSGMYPFNVCAPSSSASTNATLHANAMYVHEYNYIQFKNQDVRNASVVT